MDKFSNRDMRMVLESGAATLNLIADTIAKKPMSQDAIRDLIRNTANSMEKQAEIARLMPNMSEEDHKKLAKVLGR